jgi:hypothetical protein
LIRPEFERTQTAATVGRCNLDGAAVPADERMTDGI